MSNIVLAQVTKLATALGLDGDARELVDVLKLTAFKGEVSDAQMAALLVVANQYGLNPWTKEIYAFPDKSNGIVPVVGVDGWSRIVNDHADFDGMEFRQSDTKVRMTGAKSDAPEWMECVIYRKSRSKPTIIREYLDETYREPFKGKYGDVTGPWQTHPKRFLRHKTMIQCSRIAFGYSGIYDKEEAERIKEAQPIVKHMGQAEEVSQDYPQADFDAKLPDWKKQLDKGVPSERLILFIHSKNTSYTLTDAQQKTLRDYQPATAAPVQQQEVTDVQAKPAPASDAPAVDPVKLEASMKAAADLDHLYDLGNQIEALADEAQVLRLREVFDARVAELEG